MGRHGERGKIMRTQKKQKFQTSVRSPKMMMSIIMPQIKITSIMRKIKMEIKKNTPMKMKMKVMKKDIVMIVRLFSKDLS